LALEEINKALESAVEDENPEAQRLTLHKKGLLDLEIKSIDEAQRTADKLKQIIEDGMVKKSISLHHHLVGKIELKKGDYSKAIDLFKEVLPLLAADESFNMILAESLASAYYRAEDLDRARTEYERIISFNLGRFEYGDIYAKAFYMLGKIHEQLGNSTKAIEHYEKFLSLWKAADPGLPELDDAKKRLAGLREK
jgi:tetratricopeptide (TPR) repeat protein